MTKGTFGQLTCEWQYLFEEFTKDPTIIEDRRLRIEAKVKTNNKDVTIIYYPNFSLLLLLLLLLHWTSPSTAGESEVSLSCQRVWEDNKLQNSRDSQSKFAIWTQADISFQSGYTTSENN